MFLSTMAIVLLQSCKEEIYPGPLSPEASMATFHLDENFEVSLFASEPLVMDPVEMIFDEKGNIYVVEMPDYPFQPEGEEGAGRIKQLFDRDKDGIIDDAVIFADSVKDATSLQVWKEGLLVTAAPYIYYMKDTDGDHKADVREVLFEGFFKNNQEAQITNLRFNIDNWIYASNHGQAGSVHSGRQPQADALDTRGSDFRFRLDQNKFENATGTAQFGQTFNDWGHRFISHNTTHIRQTVIPWRYIHRHKYLPGTQGALNISNHDLLMFQLSKAPYWRVERSRRRQQQYDAQNLNRIEHVDSHFTGSSGGTHYGADLFPPEYQGNIFTGEVMGNLIHRDVIRMPLDQPTYIASRAEKERDREFLASTDEWFRPDNFTVGPDGALYVIDMYRQHIETPLSIPEDLKEDMDFMRGEDMGRIYRIVPKGKSPAVIPDDLSMNHNTSLYLEWLGHPNQWYRLNGQRLLLEQQDQSVVPEVKSKFLQDRNPVTRLHALYVLDGMNALTEDLVNIALTDPAPGVREHALILAEKFPGCLPNMIVCTKDSSARVVLQAALSLGSGSRTQQIVPVLADILQTRYHDKWIRMAVLSSYLGSSAALVSELLLDTGFLEELNAEKEQLLYELGYIIGSRNDEMELIQLLSVVESIPDAARNSVLGGLATGVVKSENELTSEVRSRLQTYFEKGDATLKEALKEII